MSDDRAMLLRQALNVVVNCWDDMLPAGPKGISVGTIGRTSEVVLPVPAHVLEVRRVALLRLSGWCQVVMDDQDLHPRLSGVDAVSMARFLTIHADYLATIGDEPADELADTKHAIEGVVEPPAALEFVGPCEVCGGDLRSRGGPAVCRECKAVVDAETTRERLTQEALDKIMPASEIVTLAPRMWDTPVTAVHMSRWVKRGDLVTAGQVMCDGGVMRAGYRVRDVEVLVSRMSARRTA